MNVLWEVIDYARQNIGFGTLGMLATWCGIAWVWYRKRADWSRKEFLRQINFSVSYVADGKLVIRTLLETSAQQVWLNDRGVQQIIRAAARTTPTQPFIRLADPGDMAFLYRAVLNVLSEKFADAFLAQGMDLPAQFATYRFAVTCERFADMRTLKIRVLLIRDEDLQMTFADGNPVEVPSAYYAPRLQALREMAKLFAGAGQPGVMTLGRVVLGLRVQPTVDGCYTRCG